MVMNKPFPLYREVVIKIYVNNQLNILLIQNQVRNAIGGLSVGEPAEMYAMTEIVCEIFTRRQNPLLDGRGNSDKYFRKNIALGVDMFDV
jgi:queuine tRNA-ribosyltransferase